MMLRFHRAGTAVFPTRDPIHRLLEVGEFWWVVVSPLLGFGSLWRRVAIGNYQWLWSTYGNYQILPIISTLIANSLSKLFVQFGSSESGIIDACHCCVLLYLTAGHIAILLAQHEMALMSPSKIILWWQSCWWQTWTANSPDIGFNIPMISAVFSAISPVLKPGVSLQEPR